MNEIHSKFEGMVAAGMTQIVAKLVLLLITHRREEGDRDGELVVAESFEAGDRQREVALKGNASAKPR